MVAVTSPTAGTRIEPIDGYKFVRGTKATFKITFMSEGIPTVVDTGTVPIAQILEPNFLSKGDTPSPNVLATIQGSLVSGQTFEYKFEWDIPTNQTPLDTYIISYTAKVGGAELNFGDEFFAVLGSPGTVGIKFPSYATVSDVRMKKFNIDDYLPPSTRKDVVARDNLIENHLRDATTRLREELNLSKSRGNSENYKLFCVYYAIWSILLASRGEDGSSVSSENLSFWRAEWARILEQEKRESRFQGIPVGRG